VLIPSSRPASAATVTIKVNFQPAASTVPNGYVADRGHAFDATRGYGWVKVGSTAGHDLTAWTRQRNRSTTLWRDTLIHLQPPGVAAGAWEHAVPNGTYTVTVAAGDPAYFDSVHRVNIEGRNAIPGFRPTAKDQVRVKTLTVQVSDGRLTIDAIGGSNTKLHYVEIQGEGLSSPSGSVTSPTTAPSPAPQTGGSGTWPRGQRVRDALGSHVQNGDYAGFERWLGRSINYQLKYASRKDREALRKTLTSWPAQSGNRTAVLSLATVLDSDPGSSKDALRASANGRYDDLWKAFGAELRRVASTKGWTFPDGRPRWILRVNWEANGTWFKHSYVGAEAEFRASVRRMVQTVNAPQVPVVFGVGANRSNRAQMEAAYPGDDVIDIIELDLYDSWGRYAPVGGDADPSRRTTTWAMKSGLDGNTTANLKTVIQFAKDHGKAVAIGETSVWREKASVGQVGGGDNPNWYPNLVNFLTNNAIGQGVPVAYVNQFEVDPHAGQKARLMTGNFPNAAASFKRVFG